MNILFVTLFVAAPATGLQVNRYEPTPAGETFFGVNAPWYRNTRLLSAGLTLDLAHNPVVGGTYGSSGNFHRTVDVISTQFIGHADFALAPLDWLLLSASLPVTFVEDGTAAFGVTPLNGMAVGDPRLGADVRAFGDATRDVFSLHFGGRLWIPVGAEDDHAGDDGVRGNLQAMAGGRVAQHLQWAANAGALFRGQASLNGLANGLSSVGSELQVAGAAAYVDDARHFNVAVEALFATGIAGSQTFESNTHLEALVDGSYTFFDALKVGPGIAVGIVRGEGTPALRGLLRIAYVSPSGAKRSEAERAPAASPEPAKDEPAKEDDKPSDTDGDGVRDSEDACPDEPVGANPDPQRSGCPAPVVEQPRAAEQVQEKVEQPQEPRVFVFAGRQSALPQGCHEEPAYPQGHRLLTMRFATGSDTISAEDIAALDDLAGALRAAPQTRVSVDGYTDDVGDSTFNQALSERRAKSAAAVLTRAGVSSRRIDIRGYGPSQPPCPGTSDDERAAARRTEVNLVSGP